jgi:hypothetical protein
VKSEQASLLVPRSEEEEEEEEEDKEEEVNIHCVVKRVGCCRSVSLSTDVEFCSLTSYGYYFQLFV